MADKPKYDDMAWLAKYEQRKVKSYTRLESDDLSTVVEGLERLVRHREMELANVKICLEYANEAKKEVYGG